MAQSTRRTFIQSSLAAGAALTLPTGRSLGANVNEQVQLAIIGCGWRGGQLRDAFHKVSGVRIAGFCDPDRQLLDEVAVDFPKAQKWTDLRSVFDSKDIDAVVISTCNHWHCLAAIWAMQAGKHVYVEKPLGNTLWEGRQLVNASQKYERICQIGTQQRSDPIQDEIKELLHRDQLIGELQSVRVNRFGVRKSIGKRTTPLSPPKSLDYNLWLGPAKDLPIYREKWHYDWHWVWNTGAGEMGNWGVHLLDDVRNNVFQDQIAFPKAVVAAGGRFGWNDAGETPNALVAILDTGSIPVVIGLCNLPDQPGSEDSPTVPEPTSGYIVYGEGGRLEGQRAAAAAFDIDGKLIKKFASKGGMIHHQKSFVDAIRNNDPTRLAAPVEGGHYSTAWCEFANLAMRTCTEGSGVSMKEAAQSFKADLAPELFQQMREVVAKFEPDASPDVLSLGPILKFDAQSEQFVGDHAQAANRLLRRNDRKPFVVPEVSMPKVANAF